MSHIVTAPLVISKKADGSDLYLYEGSELPDWASDDEIKRLVDLGMVEKVDGRKPSSKAKPTADSN